MVTETLWVSLEGRSRTNSPHQRFHSQLFCKIVRYFCRTLYILCESIKKACAVNRKVARTTTWWELEESMSFTFCYCFCTLSLASSQLNSPQTLVLIKFYGIEKSGQWSVKFWTNKLGTSSNPRFNQFEINKADLCSVWKVEKSITDARGLDLRVVWISNLRYGNAFSQQQAVPHRSPCLNSASPVDAVCVREWLISWRGEHQHLKWLDGPKSRKLSVWLRRTVKVTRW